MKIYNITKGQFITMWIVGLLMSAVFYDQATNGYWDFDVVHFQFFLADIIVLGFLIFYSIGRKNWKKKNK